VAGRRAIVDGPVTTTIHPPLSLRADVVGHAAKRGLIPRTPTGERLLTDLETWLTAEYADTIRSTRRRTLDDGATELAIALHPAAPDVRLTADDTGRVTASAETVMAGPGYHRFVGRVIERAGLEHAIAWGQSPDEAELVPDGGLTFADRQAVERTYLGWLGETLVDARSALRIGDRHIHVGLPAGTRYRFDGAIATALGPRDAAWLDAAIADPRVAIDITPWWADATDGRYLLNRALCLMWLHVRWRPPAVDGEAETLDEVHKLLARAYPLEPTLPYPWTAWAEIVGIRQIPGPIGREAVARAASDPAPVPPIGFRRDEVIITHEGWSLEITGSFAERRSAEEWWGGGAGRSITLAATPTGTEYGAMSARAFLDQVANDLGPDALHHEAGPIMGRARLTSDASSGLEVGVLEGYAAVTGSGAAVRIVYDDPGDWQWAIDMWRSLAPA
jgi:hypothetical protein